MSLLRQMIVKTPQGMQWTKFGAVPLCRTMALGSRDTPSIDVSAVLAKPEELEQKKKLSGTISVPVKVNLSPINGVPDEHVRTRRVRIHIPPKNAMQSGTNNVQTWQIEFDNRERWENPLMGWSSTGDPLSNMQINFTTKEEAITHCEQNGWRWFVDSKEEPKKERVKNYGLNFSWNRRTRVSTK